jgi:glycosyltransferase involved in cell wall biosynthesis
VIPRASVVIPAYNAESFIAQTLESALAQDLGDVEIIVIDDGSRDDTARVVRTFGSAVSLLDGGGRGVSAARNLGIERSTGDYVAFLDHDDLWHPTMLRRGVEILEACPETALTFAQILPLQDGKLGEACPVLPADPAFLRNAYRELVFWNFIPMSTVVVRRSVLLDLPRLFDTRLRLAEDWELWLRIAEATAPAGFAFVPEPLATYVIRPGRATDRTADLRLEDISVLEAETARNPWLQSDDRRRYRERLFRLYDEAGYWLLREGRGREAARYVLGAWRARPTALRTLLRIAPCLLSRLHPGRAAQPRGNS